MDTKPKQTRRRYTDEEKAAALETVNLCGGNVTEASRVCGIERETLREWAKGVCVSDKVFADFAAKKAGRATAVVRALNARLAEALFDESKIEAARYGELVTAYGVTFDKLRLIDEKPTAITESRNAAELRREAEEILAALLPEYGHDRAAALAAMREAAPTLSEYIN